MPTDVMRGKFGLQARFVNGRGFRPETRSGGRTAREDPLDESASFVTRRERSVEEQIRCCLIFEAGLRRNFVGRRAHFHGKDQWIDDDAWAGDRYAGGASLNHILIGKEAILFVRVA